jgi:hypothetical protein
MAKALSKGTTVHPALDLVMNPPNPGSLFPGGFGPNYPWVQWNALYVALACFVSAFLCPLDHALALYGLDERDRPSFLAAHGGWMAFVLLRNLGLTMLVYTGWHHLVPPPPCPALPHQLVRGPGVPSHASNPIRRAGVHLTLTDRAGARCTLSWWCRCP